MTLIVFLVPVIPLFPLKLVGLWLLTHEYWLGAFVTIVFGKFLGVGVTAFIFDVTRTKLLEMRWFEKLYEIVLTVRAKAAALVEPVKQRIVELMRGDGDGWSSRDAAADPAFSQERARGALSATSPRRLSVIARYAKRPAIHLTVRRRLDARFAGNDTMRASLSMQMQQMRREDAERGDGDARQRQQRRIPRPAR